MKRVLLALLVLVLLAVGAGAAFVLYRKHQGRNVHGSSSVEFFCYPAGRYDDTVIAAVKAAGFLGATTTREGLATPRHLFTLNRVRVDGTDGVAGLQHKLAVASAA